MVGALKPICDYKWKKKKVVFVALTRFLQTLQIVK